VQPFNRMSRCRRRKSLDEPWQGDPVVGETFRDGEFTDAADYLADQRGDASLREPTGKHGLVRVDQAHVTPALRPAILDYRRVDPGSGSDHDGIEVVLDLDLIDRSHVREYT
jgi:hypothetical protein